MPIQNHRRAPGVSADLVSFEARHLPGALKLSQEMAWPYRLEDWAFAAELGKGVVIEREGVVLGTAMCWQYGAEFASAGMIIVTASAQGLGFGSRLFDALLDIAGARNVLLSSTEEGLALYKRRGFTTWGVVLQHQGPLMVAPPSDARADMRPATAADLPAIQALDARAVGMPRQAMVAALAGVGDVLVMERNGRIAGYAISRRFGRGYVIGPVAAESIEDAKHLILKHLSTLQGAFVRIDVYAHHELSDWLQGLGLAHTGTGTAMVKGSLPSPDRAARMFALANQSFG